MPSLLPSGVHARQLVPDVQALVNLSYAHPLPGSDPVDAAAYKKPTVPLENPPSDLPEGGWNVSSLDTLFHNAFQPLDAAYRFGEELAAEFPDIVQSVDIGTSAEGRVIRGWSAHINKEGHENNADEFIIISGQHAREVSQRCERDVANALRWRI